MPKYVMVDTISQFRMRYVVEVPDNVDSPSERMYPCTPEQYASDSVACEDTREFSQEHLGETIVSTREVSLEEAIAQWRKDNGGAFDSWSDELVVKNSITEIGFNREEYYEKEEEKWAKKEEERLKQAVIDALDRPLKTEEWEENNERMDIIGQNGNDGLHYDEITDKDHDYNEQDGGVENFK